MEVIEEKAKPVAGSNTKCRISSLLVILAVVALGAYFLYQPSSAPTTQSQQSAAFIDTASQLEQLPTEAATQPAADLFAFDKLAATDAPAPVTQAPTTSAPAKPTQAAALNTALGVATTTIIPPAILKRFEQLYSGSSMSQAFWQTGNMVLEHEDAYPEAKVFRADLLESVITPFQHIEIYKSPSQGHILFLNQSMQLTELEAPHYHEIIVHTALAYMPQASSALVVGGGDGHTLAELLKHKNLNVVMQVEIDQLVMDLCAKYFPGIRATYADPRATVVVKDVRHFLAEQMASPSPMLFDLIIIDSTDIDLSIGLAQTLGSYKRLLKPRGILICEVDTGGPQKLQGFADDFEIFKDKFEYTNFFVSHGTAWVSGSIVFAFCSDAIHPMRESVNWAAFQAKRMPLQYYNPAVHYSSFALPSVYLRAVKQTLNDIAPKWFFEPDDDEEGDSGSEGPGVVGLSQYLV